MHIHNRVIAWAFVDLLLDTWDPVTHHTAFLAMGNKVLHKQMHMTNLICSLVVCLGKTESGPWEKWG